MNNIWRNDFPWFKNNPDKVYLDTASTALKPQYVIDGVVDYYTTNSVNHHNQDHDLARDINTQITQSRQICAKFLNCKEKEITFVESSTTAMNKIVLMLRNKFKRGGEVIVCKTEHNSSLLPWISQIENGVIIKYADLKKSYKPTVTTIMDQVTQNTKVVVLTHKTNVLGTIMDVRKVYDAIKKFNPDIYVIVDGAQSVASMKVDLQVHKCDFYFFGAHKIYGPTGIGVLYINEKHHNLPPAFYGGGIITEIYSHDMTLKPAPYKYESGTLNIAGIIGMSRAIEYIQMIGMDNIQKHLSEVRSYAIEKLESLNNIIFYNKNVKSPTIVFNIKGISAKDVSSYLSSRGILLRAGWGCATQMSDVLKVDKIIRLSLAIYSSKEDIDKVIIALKDEKTFLSHLIDWK